MNAPGNGPRQEITENNINLHNVSYTTMQSTVPPADAPKDRGQAENKAPELEKPKEITGPRGPQTPGLVDYHGFKIVPEPEKKRRHPLLEAGIFLAKLPFKMLVEWPVDALNYFEQRIEDRRSREMTERTIRNDRLRKMFPKPPEEKKHRER